MLFPRRLLAATLSCAIAATGFAAKRAKPTRPDDATALSSATAYKGAIILDAATGNTLFEDRADEVSPPASMTKLMTFAVLQDKLASGAITLATPVRVTPADAAMGGTQVYLDPRETFPVEELVYAMMIQSANDAAHALARVAAGSVDAFVELMNAKARELGMTHTTFRTPHGLPPSSRKLADGDLTTPRDYALLSRYLLLKTDVTKYTSIRTRAFGAGVRAQPIAMTNHNHLLGKVDGVDGLKTGFTNGASFCIAVTAQRNGRRIIVVTMGSPDSKTRDIKVADLIERGFAALPANAVAFPPTAPGASLPVSSASSPITPAPLPAGQNPPAAPADASPTIKFSIPKK